MVLSDKEKDEVLEKSMTYDSASEKFKKKMTREQYKKMLENQVAWESASIVAETMEKVVNNCKKEKRQETRELLLSIVEEMSSEANRIVTQLSKMIPDD